MQNAEVISTFVYKNGIKGLQFSLTTAVGLFQSVVGVFFLLFANWLSRKLGERGIW
jgi:putative aldouronate transport system permease protein